MRRLLILFGSLAGALYLSANPPMPVVGCPCDHSAPETLKARVCSLCGTAEKQTDDVYFLKDINPHKPNRYLALLRAHDIELQHIGGLSAANRTLLWSRAIERAEELFGQRWGLAHNAYFFRTQCHVHLHMGPLSPEVEDVGGRLYDSVADFPLTGPDEGLWVHSKGEEYCVHRDRDLAEVVLIR